MPRLTQLGLIIVASLALTASASLAYDPSPGSEPPLFGKQVHEFELTAPPRRLGVVSEKPKGARIPVFPRDIDEVRFTLAKVGAGYLDGTVCRRKPVGDSQKRCPLGLKGSRTLNFGSVEPVVYMTFGGRWNGRTLSPGKYILTARLESPVEIELTIGK